MNKNIFPSFLNFAITHQHFIKYSVSDHVRTKVKITFPVILVIQKRKRIFILMNIMAVDIVSEIFKFFCDELELVSKLIQKIRYFC